MDSVAGAASSRQIEKDTALQKKHTSRRTCHLASLGQLGEFILSRSVPPKNKAHAHLAFNCHRCQMLICPTKVGTGPCHTLPETNMETQKGPYKDYSPFKGGLYGFPPFKGGLYGFPCEFGGNTGIGLGRSSFKVSNHNKSPPPFWDRAANRVASDCVGTLKRNSR